MAVETQCYCTCTFATFANTMFLISQYRKCSLNYTNMTKFLYCKTNSLEANVAYFFSLRLHVFADKTIYIFLS